MTDGGLRVLGRGSVGFFLLRGGGRYEGAWRDDERHGPGIMTYSSGSR